ncbi:MAG: hypothetical protein PHR39_00855 [Actinomycetota bacterium]|nr:hypothetical protein [Actinomycetota bacterium]
MKGSDKDMNVMNIKNVIPENNIIVFSPHYDDFIFFLGGYIFELIEADMLNSKKFTNINVYSRSNYQNNDEKGNADTSIDRIKYATGKRIIEDFECLDDLLGAHNYVYRVLGEFESQLRGKVFADSDMEFPHGMYEDFNDMDKKIFSRMKTYVREYSQLKDTALVFPIGFKEHIDHFIVREAAIVVAHELGNRANAKFYFAEDKPYGGIADEKELLRIEDFIAQNKLETRVFKHHPQKLIDIVFKHYISQVEEVYITGIKNRNEILKKEYGLNYDCDCIYVYNIK